MNFALQPFYSDRGVSAITSTQQYRICRDGVLREAETPLGSVEWTEKLLGRSVVPDFHPQFLAEHLHRKTWTCEKWPVGRRCFIKPTHRHKAWRAKVYNGLGYKGKKPGPYLCSEVVRFRNEYRYYVVSGRVLSGWWYWGDSTDEQQRHEGADIPDAPQLPDIAWPDSYCGAVDFGELWDTGQLALIEANAPFACGWYGENSRAADYALFLAEGWKFIQKL